MADKKISALTAATTPLAGTEVLPIVQSGATVKVANNDLRPKQIQSNATSGVLQIAGPAAAATRVMTVPDANFTAARTDAANSFTGDQTLSTGNLIQGTAAKGFNFSANTPAAGMTSQLLNWYEQGIWTPTFVASGTALTSVTYANTGGRYVRIGNLVHIQGYIETTAVTKGSASGYIRVGGLPFTSVSHSASTYNGWSSISVSYSDMGGTKAPQNGYVNANATTISWTYATGVSTGPNPEILVADFSTTVNYIMFAGTYICA